MFFFRLFCPLTRQILLLSESSSRYYPPNLIVKVSFTKNYCLLRPIYTNTQNFLLLTINISTIFSKKFESMRMIMFYRL